MFHLTYAIASVSFIGFALAVPTLRQTQLGGPEVPPDSRTCTPTGQKCAGESGFPNVPFAACCDGTMVCQLPLNPGSTWGMFCIRTSEATDDKAKQVTEAPSTSAPATSIATSQLASTEMTTTSPASSESTTAISSEPTTVVTLAPTTTISSTPTTTVTSTPTTTQSSTSTTSASSSTTSTSSTTSSSTTTTANTTSTTMSTATSTTSETSDGGSECFPSHATVELAEGRKVRMDALSIGDRVRVAGNKFSRVFMFTHKQASAVAHYKAIRTVSGHELVLTAGHYVHADGGLVRAGAVLPGAHVTLADGRQTEVVSVGSAHGQGLFNPQTESGDIVVDGVLASTYTTAVQPGFAHAVLLPLRFVSWFTTVTALESGGGGSAAKLLMPRGADEL